MLFFFFSSRRRHTRWPRDWSSDVCSSDLRRDVRVVERGGVADLTQKPVGGDGDRELGMQHLDCDLATVSIEGAVERGIAAAPHRGDDVIAVAQRLADPPDQFPSHRGSIGGPARQKGRVRRFYWGGSTRVQWRLSKMANPEPVPANRTAAMPVPVTQSRWDVCCVVDSVRLRTLPLASSASMNAAPPGRRS